MSKEEIALLFRCSHNKRYSIETLFTSLNKLNNVKKIIMPYELNSILNSIKICFFLLKIKQKFIHISGDIHYVAILLFWKKIIITIHDLNYYESLKGFKKIIYGLVWFRLPLIIAKKIIVISPYTKLQLLYHFKVNENKIIIIPNTFLKFNPINQINFENKTSRFQILCIGFNENKNLNRLIDSLQVSDKVYLRLIGEQSNEIVSKLKRSNIPFSIAKNLTREELMIEYKSSNILYFASTKEGFGLPILEAQSLGIPVITSNTTAMPYVAGAGAIIVDPYSVESIRDAILSLVNGKINIEELKEKGYANVERFSELNFIDEHIKVYETFFL